MNRLVLAVLTVAILLIGGTAEAMREGARQAAPAVCVLPGEEAPVVFEGRGLAFVPGGGKEPVIVRRIVPKPCSLRNPAA